MSKSVAKPHRVRELQYTEVDGETKLKRVADVNFPSKGQAETYASSRRKLHFVSSATVEPIEDAVVVLDAGGA